MKSHYNLNDAEKYEKFWDSPSLCLLIKRDTPIFIKQYIKNGYVLDFGCGPGKSSQFLHQLGFDVIGVDVNINMLKRASLLKDNISFMHIKHSKIPIKENTFDTEPVREDLHCLAVKEKKSGIFGCLRARYPEEDIRQNYLCKAVTFAHTSLRATGFLFGHLSMDNDESLVSGHSRKTLSNSFECK